MIIDEIIDELNKRVKINLALCRNAWKVAVCSRRSGAGRPKDAGQCSQTDAVAWDKCRKEYLRCSKGRRLRDTRIGIPSRIPQLRLYALKSNAVHSHALYT